jgi:hypothetical protein
VWRSSVLVAGVSHGHAQSRLSLLWHVPIRIYLVTQDCKVWLKTDFDFTPTSSTAGGIMP